MFFKTSIVKCLQRIHSTRGRAIEPAPGHTDSARPEQGKSAFLDLPSELLDKILGYRYSVADLNALRLVCFAFHNAIGRRCSEEERILQLPLTRDGARWKRILSFTQSAMWTDPLTLRIVGLEEDRRPSSRCLKFPFDQELYSAQKRFLLPTLDRLKGVKAIHWKIPMRLHLNKQILSSIKRMRNLESAHLEIDFTTDTRGHYPWALHISPGFPTHKLVSLSLSVYPQSRDCQVDIISNDIHHLLASCSLLETLSLTGWRDPDSYEDKVDFSNLIRFLPDAPGFQPTLTSLHLRQMSLTLSPICLRYLANLSSLSISNDHDHDGVSVWAASSSAGIELKILKVALITRELLSYLRGYRGLREFHGVIEQERMSSSTSFEPETTTDVLLGSVLPLHHDSLEAFIVCPPIGLSVINGSEALRWAYCESQITALRKFPKLKTVEVAFLFANSTEGVMLSWENAVQALYELAAFRPSTQVHMHPYTSRAEFLELFGSVARQIPMLSSLKLAPPPNGIVPSAVAVFVYGRRCPLTVAVQSPTKKFLMDMDEFYWEDPRSFLRGGDVVLQILKERGVVTPGWWV